MDDGIRIKNVDGLIAIQHRTSNPTTIKLSLDPEEVIYSFIPKHNVSMAWVRPEHVDLILKIQARMCCGKTGAKFHLASQINVNLWETGDRHGVSKSIEGV